MEPVRSIDLETDKAQWGNGLGGEDKGLVYFALASLMVARSASRRSSAALVMAAGSEEEATFLATQQVDEARHMQFYARFQDEVIAEPAVIADHVARSREQARRLVRADLRRGARRGARAAGGQPARPGAKVGFVTTTT